MSRLMKALPAFALFAVIGLAAATTHANPLSFSDRSLYNAATAGVSQTVINFEGSTTDTSQPLPSSIALGGAVFSIGSGRSNAGVEVILGTNVGAPGTNVLTASGNIIGPLNGLNNIEITLPTGTTSVGFDIKSGNSMAGSTTGGTYEVIVNGVTFSVVVPTYSSFSFFGVTDSAGITSIAIRAISGGEPVLDNVTYGPTAAAVPEPASMVLLGTGLIGLASAFRKRRNHTTTQTDDLAGGR